MKDNLGDIMLNIDIVAFDRDANSVKIKYSGGTTKWIQLYKTLDHRIIQRIEDLLAERRIVEDKMHEFNEQRVSVITDLVNPGKRGYKVITAVNRDVGELPHIMVNDVRDNITSAIGITEEVADELTAALSEMCVKDIYATHSNDYTVARIIPGSGFIGYPDSNDILGDDPNS